MACPYFYPLQRLETGQWLVPPRFPLGEAFAGECRAAGGPVAPDSRTLATFCNTGYAREHCRQFPAGQGADAVRFHICSTDLGTLSVQYIQERGCWPLHHGIIEFSPAGERRTSAGTEILDRQACAFVESYLSRTRIRH